MKDGINHGDGLDGPRTSAWAPRLGVAALILIATTILGRVAAFVLGHSTSVFRNLSLHPVSFLGFLPLGLVVGATVLLVVKRVTASRLVVAILAVIVAGVAWWGIQHEPLSGFLMPEATTK